jgi:predicted PurR-regulated permease PerM
MKYDFLKKATQLFLLVFLIIAGLYYSKAFLIPIIIGVLLALLLLPLNRFLEKKGMNKIVAILISLFSILIVVSTVITLFLSQLINLGADMPLIKQKVSERFIQVQREVQSMTRISSERQLEYLEGQYSNLMESSTNLLGSIFVGFTGGLATFGLIFVYIFFFLLYRSKIKIFLLKISPSESHQKIDEITDRIKELIQHYLSGILIELSILGALNSIGLLIIGVKQPFFFGYLAALLNIIPYVGVLIGSIFPITMALIFKESIWAAVAVAGVMAFNQFVDNNFLTPKIVGSHVRINPLVTIMAIVAGGLLWGIPGMVLFIPLLGIIKIICDNIESLRPLGYMLGDDEEEEKVKKRKHLIQNVMRRNS